MKSSWHRKQEAKFLKHQTESYVIEASKHFRALEVRRGGYEDSLAKRIHIIIDLSHLDTNNRPLYLYRYYLIQLNEILRRDLEITIFSRGSPVSCGIYSYKISRARTPITLHREPNFILNGQDSKISIKNTMTFGKLMNAL